ncbi:TIGR00153 family protein [Spongiibacter nanhainus]|uniref:TIGR00153 family protein n=1 Tax=Spongiibacter nanhainus TaxID=2794344 RepID=A0A7T4R4B9_9GAMM|nr:TIGR00153 family protein [Spongiibacter nanhainus]QQD20231.1 TIGR00153 family protein [Spongiibacter nanhainus]
MNPLSNLFGKSPFVPLQEHMEVVQDCASHLVPFFDAVLEGNWEKAKQEQAEIVALENKADDIKKKLRLHLPKNLFMPVPRNDVLELLRSQDQIANLSRDIVGIMVGREMAIPEPLEEMMRTSVALAVAATLQALKGIEELDELLESGFRGPEVDFVERLIEQLDTLEHDTDDHKIKVRTTLFKIEKDYNPVDVMFLYQIIDWVSDIADKAQRVGSRLQILIAR